MAAKVVNAQHDSGSDYVANISVKVADKERAKTIQVYLEKTEQPTKQKLPSLAKLVIGLEKVNHVALTEVEKYGHHVSGHLEACSKQ